MTASLYTIEKETKTLAPALRWARRLALATTASAVVMGLGGCDRGPSTGDLTSAINASIGQPVCWTMPGVSNAGVGAFPIQVTLPAAQINAASQPILAGLVASGDITVGRPASTGFEPAAALNIDLTDKGRQAQVWDSEHGFCVGTPTVRTIEHVTDPEHVPTKITRVTYTWSLEPARPNMNPAAFSRVPGMTTPVKAQANLVQTENGWRVAP